MCTTSKAFSLRGTFYESIEFLHCTGSCGHLHECGRKKGFQLNKIWWRFAVDTSIVWPHGHEKLKTAYLNGTLNEEIYMQQPEGFKDKKGE